MENVFVYDVIESVADYNSLRVGVNRRCCRRSTLRWLTPVHIGLHGLFLECPIVGMGSVAR